MFAARLFCFRNRSGQNMICPSSVPPQSSRNLSIPSCSFVRSIIGFIATSTSHQTYLALLSASLPSPLSASLLPLPASLLAQPPLLKCLASTATAVEAVVTACPKLAHHSSPITGFFLFALIMAISQAPPPSFPPHSNPASPRPLPHPNRSDRSAPRGNGFPVHLSPSRASL